MPIIVRHDLTITGHNVERILEFIGFRPHANPPVFIDLSRITNPPPKASSRWQGDDGVTTLEECFEDFVIERADDRIEFAFHTTYPPAFDVIDELASRFPDYRFHLAIWILDNDILGEAVWTNGKLAMYIPMFEARIIAPSENQQYSPASVEMLMAAEQLMRDALQRYNATILMDGETIDLVAEAMSQSGRPVTVEVRFHPDRTAYFVAKVEPEHYR